MTFNVLLITKEGEELFGELTIDDKLYFTEKKVGKVDYIVTPTMFNSHVHLGDSIAKDPNFMDLESLVGPGGYKFRMLSLVSEDEIVSSMRNSIEVALNCGTLYLADFREGGIRGLKMLKDADERNVCVKLARPLSIEEAELMVKFGVDGFGMSSTRDHDPSFLEELRSIAVREKILFAIHAGEKNNDDVEDALSLEPDLLVHMNMAEPRSLKRAMDERIPIVSCPKSNVFFNLFNRENYRLLLSYDLWLLGTDNVMLAAPCMLSEINFASYLLKEDKDVFCAALRGYNFFNRDYHQIIFHTKGNLYKARSLRSVVRRASANDIMQITNKELVLE